MSNSELWVFGYGSLIWDPGFEVSQRAIARLHGYQRSFCMRSIHHRGTVADPGLVLALDAAQSAYCDGVAFRAQPGTEDAALAYLRERELVSSAYLEISVDVRTHDGAEIRAITYVIDPDHDQYCGELPLEEQAQIIASAVGGRGPNFEYLLNTSSHLRDLGLQDMDLDWLSNRVTALRERTK